jgi:hypothetical protein
MIKPAAADDANAMFRLHARGTVGKGEGTLKIEQNGSGGPPNSIETRLSRKDFGVVQ